MAQAKIKTAKVSDIPEVSAIPKIIVQLRPLLVVTGAIHIEGGYTSEVQTSAPGPRGATLSTVKTNKTRARRDADVVASVNSRRVKKLRVLKTPYGLVLHAHSQPTLEAIMRDIARDVAAFNARGEACQMHNCMIFEPLAGARLQGVTGWINWRLRAKDAAVIKALPKILPVPKE